MYTDLNERFTENMVKTKEIIKTFKGWENRKRSFFKTL